MGLEPKKKIRPIVIYIYKYSAFGDMLKSYPTLLRVGVRAQGAHAHMFFSFFFLEEKNYFIDFNYQYIDINI